MHSKMNIKVTIHSGTQHAKQQLQGSLFSMPLKLLLKLQSELPQWNIRTGRF
jgi:hypothetical protein